MRVKIFYCLVSFFLILTNLSADALPLLDTFSNNSADGYSRDDGDSNELRINKDKIS